MAKTLGSLLACWLLVASFAPPARARQAEAPDPVTEGLRALAGEAAELDDAVMRIYVESTLAEALWDRDEPLARKLLERALVGYASLGAYDLMGDRDAVLRSNLTNHITSWLARDLDFVRAVARATPEPPAPAPGTVFIAQSPRSFLLLEIAGRAAQSGKLETAAELVRESVRGAIPPTIDRVLDDIAERDRAAADGVARDAIREVESRGGTLFELGFLLPYVFGADPSAVGMASGEDGDEGAGEAGRRPRVNAQLAAAHLEAVRAAAERYLAAVDAARATKQRPRSLWFTAHWAFSYYAHMQHYAVAFERYDLPSAPAARGLTERLGALLESKDKELADLFTDPQTSSERLGARAEQSADAGERERYLLHAYQRAEREGKLEEALAIAEKLGDESTRTFCVGWIRSLMANRAAGEKRFDEALRHTAEIPDPPLRAQTIAGIGQAVARSGDAKRGVELLDRAEQGLLRETNVSAFEAARARRDICAAYVALLEAKTPGVTEDRVFDVMAGAVKAANAAHGAGLDPVRHPDPNGAFVAMDFVNELRLWGPLGDLARRDPDRATALARQISMKPLSLVCRIEILKTGARPTSPTR